MAAMPSSWLPVMYRATPRAFRLRWSSFTVFSSSSASAYFSSRSSSEARLMVAAAVSGT